MSWKASDILKWKEVQRVTEKRRERVKEKSKIGSEMESWRAGGALRHRVKWKVGGEERRGEERRGVGRV